MDAVFYWIGLGVVCAFAGLIIIYAVAFVYFRCFHRRFGMILFQKGGKRRLSIASWRGAKLMDDPQYTADDWPIAPRPFYLSYRFKDQQRIFILAGIVSAPRFGAVSGPHPDDE